MKTELATKGDRSTFDQTVGPPPPLPPIAGGNTSVCPRLNRSTKTKNLRTRVVSSALSTKSRTAYILFCRSYLTGETECLTEGTSPDPNKEFSLPRGTIGMLVFAGVFVLATLLLLTCALAKRQQPPTPGPDGTSRQCVRL